MALATRIDTIFVPARDTEAAAAWYGRIFGMVEIFRSGGYVGLRFNSDTPGATALTLFPSETIREDAPAAFNFFSPEPERLRDVLIAEGCSVTEIQTNGAMSWFDFTDISGNRVNVCSFPEAR